MFPEELISRLTKTRIVAGFSIQDVEKAVPLVQALLAGGIEVIELTLRTEQGLEAVHCIASEVPEMIVGVGTILTPEQAHATKDAGAHFGVAPGTNPNVIRAAQEVSLPFAPGIANPSDIEAALELGCRFLKLFPAEALGGISYLRSMSAPYNHLGLQYFPLGGVNANNMRDYLAEPNVPTVGGSWIVQNDLVASGDWSGLTARATAVTQALNC